MNGFRPLRFKSILLVAVIATALPPAGRADAASFTVTRTDDPLPGPCLPADCSLREAVLAANDSPGSLITLPAGQYALSIPGLDEGRPDERVGDLDIRVAMTITAETLPDRVAFVIIDGSGIHRVFDNHSLALVRISGLTLRNGNDVEASGGGCIRNRGVLTLERVQVDGCTSPVAGGGISSSHTLLFNAGSIRNNTVQGTGAAAVYGGGITGFAGPALGVASTVKITNSRIVNNSVRSVGDGDLLALGGGFANDAVMEISFSIIEGNAALNAGGGSNSGTMTLTESTVIANRARYDGGGVANRGGAGAGLMTIGQTWLSTNVAGDGCVGAQCSRASAGGALNAGGGTMNVNNSTFSGNTCLVGGGGILNAQGQLTMSSSTLAENTCGGSAGVGASGTTFLKNTIVANNTAATPANGADCGGTITSQGYNLIEDTTGCVVDGDLTGDIIGVDPDLVPLERYGESTTGTRYALDPASPARNAANPAGCLDHAGALLQGDEDWTPRPEEGRCDIGADEFGTDETMSVVFRLRHPTVGAYLYTVQATERDWAQWEFGYIYEGVCCNWGGRDTDWSVLYRLYSASAGEYLFTISPQERDGAVAQFGYVFEGAVSSCYSTSAANRRPWFRLRYGNKHFYTVYPEERDAAVALGWIFEGTTCYLPAP